MAAADGKNRLVLADIGNVDTHYNVDPKKISRPLVVRSLAEAQAQAATAAAPTDIKKVAVDKEEVHVVKPAAAPPPAQENVVAAPEPKLQIETEIENPKKEATILSRKEAKSFTSTMCARSKEVCLVNNICEKKKESVIDVDAGDVENELAVVEYIDDMYKFYKLIEKENIVQDYTYFQCEICIRMRADLVSWIIEVHQIFKLEMETLYLTINIIDRYLSLQVTQGKELQLLGMGAMLMASKYEQILAPEAKDLVRILDNPFSQEQLLETEKKILGIIGWNLTVATPYVFLVRFIKVASVFEVDVKNMAHFLAELGIIHYEGAVMFTPSLLAAAAVYASRCTLLKKGPPIWNETLKVHTGYRESELLKCAKLLVNSHSNIRENKQFLSVYDKYSSEKRGGVALLPPAVLKNQHFVG